MNEYLREFLSYLNVLQIPYAFLTNYFVIKIFSSYKYLKEVFLRQHWINYFSVTVDKLFNRDQGGNCAYVNDA